MSDKLKIDVINKLLKFCFSSIETNQYSTMISFANEQDKKRTKGYVLITEIIFYLFEIDKNQEINLVGFCSFLEVNSININKNQINVIFRNNSFSFIHQNPYDIYSSICEQIKKIFWNVQTNQIRISSNILKSKYFYNINGPNKRPQYLLLKRYLCFCVAQKIKPDKKYITLFMNYKSNISRSLTLNLANLRTTRAAIMSLCIENNLKSIIFDNFDPLNLGVSLNIIFTSDNKIESIELKNYMNAKFKPFDNRKRSTPALRILKFNNCSNNFINSFIKSIETVNYQISTLIFTDIVHDLNGFENLITAFGSKYFFMNITSLAFIRSESSENSFFDFVSKIFNMNNTIRSLHIEECQIDNCDILMEFCKSESIIQQFYLRGNLCETVLEKDMFFLPPSLMLIDVGDCTWNKESLIGFLTFLCHKKRRYPLSLTIDNIKCETELKEIFESIDYKLIEPVLTELNFSKNSFDKPSLKSFLRFIETQNDALNPAHGIQYLDVSYCFTSAVSHECLKKLAKFFSSKKLWGLGICGIKPDDVISNISSLNLLDISNNKIDENDEITINKIIQDLPNISELGIDELSFEDDKRKIQFYCNMLNQKKILAFRYPEKFLNNQSSLNVNRRIKEHFNMKRKYITPLQRLDVYLSCTGEFFVTIEPAIPFLISNDEDIPSLLFSSRFKNPVNSLENSLSLFSIDFNFHPISEMVSEYIKTSGKYGTIPPTVPPVVLPTNPIIIPSIYSTIKTKEEAESPLKINFDTKCPNSISVSKLISKELKGLVSINEK